MDIKNFSYDSLGNLYYKDYFFMIIDECIKLEKMTVNYIDAEDKDEDEDNECFTITNKRNIKKSIKTLGTKTLFDSCIMDENKHKILTIKSSNHLPYKIVIYLIGKIELEIVGTKTIVFDFNDMVKSI